MAKQGIQWEESPHVLKMQQFSVATLIRITKHANVFANALQNEEELPRLSTPLRRIGKRRSISRRIRLLFYAASTRTECTFYDAATLLGCDVHIVKDPKAFSSAAKGESLESAIAHYAYQCDGIVMRHNDEGSSEKAAKVIDAMVARGGCRSVSVINAGDGKGQHPTQALVDLTMIARKRPGQFLQDITILFPGDLLNSRVVNSLLYAFGKFGTQNIKVIFCCPQGFAPKPDLLLYLQKYAVTYDFVDPTELPSAISCADVIYMTRVQRESNEAPITREQRELYVFRTEYLSRLKPKAFVMHPLPINEDSNDPPAEIAPELISLAIGGDPRCVWFQQSHLGVAVRAALLDLIFFHGDSMAAPKK